MKWLKSSKYLPAIILAVGFIGLYIFMSVYLIYNSYGSGALDLGLFVQMMKSTLHGQIMVLSANGYSQFTTHFSPILFFAVPFYWLFPYTQTLLVLQSALIGVAGFLVYYIARYFKLSNGWSLFIEVLFFVSPLVWGIALFDFHEIVFALPLLLLMIIGLLKKNWWLFGISLLLSLLVKEDITATIIVFGISVLAFTYFKQKKFSRVAMVMVVSGVVSLGVGILVSKIASHGSPMFLRYVTPTDSGALRYDYFNISLPQTIYKLAENVLSGWSILLVLYYLLPLFFLPLGTLEWVIPALFILASNVLSTYFGQHCQLNQYSAGAIPFLFIAGIITLSKLKWQGLIHRSKKYIVMGVGFGLIVISVLMSFMVENRGNLLRIPNSHDEAIDNVISHIPNGSSITSCDNIEPHLVPKYDSYLCPEPDVEGLIYGTPIYNTDYVIIDDKIVENTGWEDIIRQDKDYTLIYENDGCELYQLVNVNIEVKK